MPLEINKNKKNSLIHKELLFFEKVPQPTITMQEAPQSALGAGGPVGNLHGRAPSAASLTLEAALVFPLFLFVMVTVLSFFRVLQVTHLTSQALAQAGSQLSLTAAGEEAAVVKAAGYFHKELLEEELTDSLLVGGRLGIGFDGTSLKGEYVDLRIQYRIKLPVSLFGIGQIPIAQRVHMKKWTGYHKEGDAVEAEEEQLVYITKNGEVYHTTAECTYLRLSTRRIGQGEALAEGYTACRLCGGEPGLFSYYYVTEEGERYHTSLSCSGLKRTVYLVRLSEAEGRTACSRCGGE